MGVLNSTAFIAANGLACRLDGPDDGAWVVLSNSLGTDLTMWDGVTPHLVQKGFRVLRYDTRGHGQTRTGGSVTSIADLATDANNLMMYLGVKQAHLVGLSLGGMAFQHLASGGTVMDIQSVTLIATSAHAPPPEQWLRRALAIRREGPEAIADMIMNIWFTDKMNIDDRAHWRERFLTVDREGYAQCCEAIAKMDMRSCLPNIRARTSVVVGSLDNATPLAHGKVLAEGIPGANLTIINKAAHLIAIEKPAETAAAILQNISS